MSNKTKWVSTAPRQLVLVDVNGKIVGKVIGRNFSGPWVVNGNEYIDIESAQRALEEGLKSMRNPS